MSGIPTTQDIGVRIARPFAVVAAFLAEPLNMNRWASGLGRSLRRENGEWRADGPAGTVSIRFSPRNDTGVADHWVTIAPGVEVEVPLRVIAHGAGCEVRLTLVRQPGMSDEQYAANADWVRRDLATLKNLMEQTP